MPELKRKRRLLSKPRQTTREEIKPITRKKRSLQPIPNTITPQRSPSPSQDTIIPNEKESSPSSSVEPTSPPKRSIRAASDAIIKRKLEKVQPQEQVITNKPVMKRRRKLNTQKVVALPNRESSNDELEYLDVKETTSIPITIGVTSTKKRTIIVPDNAIPHPSLTPLTTKLTQLSEIMGDMPPPLDLSQHNILPNSDYIAHLPPPKRMGSVGDNSSQGLNEDYYSDRSSKSSSPTSEFFDAASSFGGSQEEDTLTTDFDTIMHEPEDKEDLLTAEFDSLVREPEQKGFWKSILSFTPFNSVKQEI